MRLADDRRRATHHPPPVMLDISADMRHITPVIASFADKRTAAVFRGFSPKGFPSDLLRATRRKLAQIDAARSLADLRAPSGNRLEALSGQRAGQHSIRVNDQWRIVFVWHEGQAHDVRLEDYHD